MTQYIRPDKPPEEGGYYISQDKGRKIWLNTRPQALTVAYIEIFKKRQIWRHEDFMPGTDRRFTVEHRDISFGFYPQWCCIDGKGTYLIHTSKSFDSELTAEAYFRHERWKYSSMEDLNRVSKHQKRQIMDSMRYVKTKGKRFKWYFAIDLEKMHAYVLKELGVNERNGQSEFEKEGIVEWSPKPANPPCEPTAT